MVQRSLTLTMEEGPPWSHLWDENWEMTMSITDLSSKTCSNKGEKLVEDLGKTERVGNTHDPGKKKIDGGPLDQDQHSRLHTGREE